MKKILLAILIVFMLVIPILASEFSTPEIRDKEVIEFIEGVGVQVRIPVHQVYRPLSFYKLEDGTGLTEEEIKNLNEDEKTWYEQGYIVKYGEWIGDDKDEKDQIVKTAIYGSGTVIFSDELPEQLQEEAEMYASTIVLTNYHVIQPLVDRLSLGSKGDPINVYEEIYIKTTIDPPSATFTEGARPYQQKYSFLVDEEGTAIQYWNASTNTAQIRISEDQHYEIQATVPKGGYDKGLDVGVLIIKNVAFQRYATFRRTECQVGEKVWIRHAPMAMRFSTDRGFVNQTHLDLGIGLDGLGWMDQVKLDIPSAPGSSGSGIFDERGFLIALFHGGLIHQLGQGYSYIEGGHLAHAGDKVAEWLNWRGFSYIFLEDVCKDQLKILEVEVNE
jgi:S1-C subfamily serine protease